MGRMTAMKRIGIMPPRGLADGGFTAMTRDAADQSDLSERDRLGRSADWQDERVFTPLSHAPARGSLAEHVRSA
jgi:hypothetical protein